MTPERYRKVAEVFRAVVETPLDRRQAFLDDVCAHDNALRQEVESLLRHDSAAAGWIDSRALEVAAEALASTPRGSWVNRQVHHYRVLSLIGRGGMGEVYRARDERLERDVALKVLPVEYSYDAARLRRFEQEARTVGKLNHPNIVTVYDVGLHDGAPYIVTELLDGEELREQLKQGPVAQRRALGYSRQIADGLAAAHAKGIVHRDLKPENLFVTVDGRVKILDFGLAKLKEPLRGKSVETIQPGSTTPGVVLGTANYMAPEQVRGLDADDRTDIFALGVILYEMLRGQRPFAGDSAVQVMNSILTEEPPDLAETNQKIPPVLASMVRRCLEKKPEQRFQSASDLSFALETVTPGVSGFVVKPSVGAAPRSQRYWMVPVVALAIAGIAIAWYLNRIDYWWRDPLEGATFTKLTDFPGTESEAAISRNGNLAAFLSDAEGPFDLFVTSIGTGRLDNLTKGKIADMKNPEVRSIRFSPDTSFITFWVRAPERTTVWAVPTVGGVAGHFLGGPELDWSPDPDGKRIVYHTSDDGDPIYVRLPGEQVGEQIFVAEKGLHNHFPVWSPDGAFIYFAQGFPPEEMDIWRVPSTGGSPERITSHNSRVAHLTFVDDRTLLYTTLDADGAGPFLYGINVNRRVPHLISRGDVRYTSVSADHEGRRLVASVGDMDASIWKTSISGEVTDKADRISLPTVPSLSPRIGSNYLVHLASKGTPAELWNSSRGRVLSGPAIASDGRIAFTTQKDGQTLLHVMNSDGTVANELGNAKSIRISGAPSWPPAGEWLTIAGETVKNRGLFKVPLNGGEPILLVSGEATNPVWSPDGRFVVYAGVEVGTRFQLKAATADGQAFPVPEITLSRGSSRFAFLPNQPVLVVLEGEFWHKNFWAIDLTTGRRQQLTNFPREYLIGDFDISPNGQEIIFSRLKERTDVMLIERRP
jgi:Tol biopolymer transport system component